MDALGLCNGRKYNLCDDREYKILHPNFLTLMQTVRFFRYVLLFVSLVTCAGGLRAQCDPITPHFTVDLSGDPNATYLSPDTIRAGACCGESPRCIAFTLTLHPQAEGIIFDVCEGALPSGALYYQVDCGPPTSVGQPLCLSGSGPFEITFCKPGMNLNKYCITSIAEPAAGPSVSVNDGCQGEIYVQGYDQATLNWTSIFPGATGLYDAYLGCTSGCDTVTVTGQANPPAYVDYQVCGFLMGDCDTAYYCDTIRANFYSTLGAEIQPDTPSVCFGALGTTITANGVGGNPPYVYQWSTGETTASIFVNVGTYYVTIGDSSGCPPAYDTITVTSFANTIEAFAGGDQVVCTNSLPISLSGSVQAAAGGFWFGGNGTFSPGPSSLVASYQPTAAELLQPGMELYLRTTGNGSCPADTDTLYVQFHKYATQINLFTDSTACFGDANGSAWVEYVSGMPLSGVVWNVGVPQTGDSATGIVSGTYTVLVTDTLGCDSLYSFEIGEPDSLNASFADVDSVSCAGGSDGSLTVLVTGGTVPYSYSWSNGLASAGSTNLDTGAYAITVTDANGCTVVIDTTVYGPAPLSLALSGDNISCYGSADGTVFPSVSGGTGSYTFLWNTGATADSLTGLVEGNYSLVVTDANGCTISDSMAVVEPDPFQVGVTISMVSCHGGGDGGISPVVSGAVPPYSFNWSTGQAIANISGLSAGNYALTITDSNGCTTISSHEIVEPDNLYINGVVQHVSCFGEAGGSLVTNAAGGTAPYTFAWNNGSTSSQLSGVVADTYALTLTDANGCTADSSMVVTEPMELTASAVAVHISCFGSADGAVDLTASGGVLPYSYSWSNGATTEDLSALGEGTYVFTVSDGNGCALVDSVAITEPGSFGFNASVANISCYAGNDGAIATSATGATAPFLYAWDNGQSTAQLNSLVAGAYGLTVTDANGCSYDSTFTLTEPTPLFIHGVVENVSCFGLANGSIETAASGGVPPYSYTWNTGGGTSQIINQDTGTYILTLTDANGCATDSSFVITGPTMLSYAAATTDASCFGLADGAIDLTISGGTLPYSYTWGGGAATEDISSLSAGTYGFAVMDFNGCSLTDSIVISEPDSFSFNSTIADVACHGGNTGSIATTPSGATPPYSYSWASGQATDDIFSLVAGTYALTVSDQNGCSYSSTFTVSEPDEISLNGVVTDVLCNGQSSGGITVSATGGTVPYAYSWSTGNTNSDLVNVSAGAYTVQLTDSNGCVKDSLMSVSEPAALSHSTLVTNVSCNGLADGSIGISVSGGTMPYAYAWNTGDVIEDMGALTAGNYILTITDANGCTISDNFQVSQPDSLDFNATVTPVSCKSGSDGAIATVPSGAVPPYAYSWSTGAVSAQLSGLSAGVYTLTVNDNSGCQFIRPFNVIEPGSIFLNGTKQDVLCRDGLTGAAAIIATGGNPPYQYSWNTGAASASISNLVEGTYLVTVTDSKGCSKDSAFVIAEPDSLLFQLASSDVSCNGLADGSAFLTVTGGIQPYTVLWSNGSTSLTQSALGAGSYNFTVTDDNGCQQTGGVSVAQPGPLTVVPLPGQEICLGASATVSVQVSGGNGGYVYTWDNGLPDAASHVVSPTVNTVYSVSVTDSLDCPDAVASIAVDVKPVVFGSLDVAVSPESICVGEQATVTGTYSGSVAGYSFQWSHGLGTSIGTFEVFPIIGQTYVLTITDACGFTRTDSASLEVNQVPEIKLPSPVLEGCAPFYALLDDGIDSIDIASWKWDLGNGVESALENPSMTYGVAGEYPVTLEVISADGCPSAGADTSFVLVYPRPNAGFTVDPERTDIDHATVETENLSEGASQYSWSVSDGAKSNENQLEHTFTDIGFFTVRLIATNNEGCSDTATATVQIDPTYDFDAPTAFTPNLSGPVGGMYDPTALNNDVFYVISEYVKSFRMGVYNRWGELVFESSDIRHGWDGYYRNEIAPIGPYVWKAEVEYVDGVEVTKTGNVTLLR